MKSSRIAVVAVLVSTVAVVSCALKQLDLDDLDRKEWVVLSVVVHDGKCSLRERHTSEIRTEGNSQVNWIVVGNCPAVNGKPQTITIDRKFRKNKKSEEFDPFKTEGSMLSVAIPTEAGQSVILKGMTLDRDQITKNRKGHYKYTILINGEIAQWRSPADEGDFFLCPVWPCDW
jgi:hypothetical protein